MRVAAKFSFNDGEKRLENAPELAEVYEAVSKVDASVCLTKESTEKTMPGKMLYSPKALNKQCKTHFETSGWESDVRITCDYPTQYYVDDYAPSIEVKGAFRSIDFVKNKVGTEVQFGKYSFMVYNVCAKMTIFKNQEIIDLGIEIVPVKELANEMSSGVSYFEQFVWDLEMRGVSDIDIPVLILGIAP